MPAGIFEALGKAGGEGGVLSALGNAIGGLLGGAAGGAPKTTALARGGQLPAGYIGLVGEEGPELIAPAGTSRRVMSNRQTQSTARISGTTVNISQVFQTGVTHAELAGLIPYLKASTIGAMVDANRRGAI